MSIKRPDGFKLVSKEEFFKLLYADKRDIMPSNQESPYYGVWLSPDRYLWGYTYPGYKNPRDQKAYLVRV